MKKNPGPAIDGLSEEEMMQVVILGQVILGLATGQSAGRLTNACLWIIAILCQKSVPFAEATVRPLESLVRNIELMVAQAKAMNPPAPDGGEMLH